MHTPLQNTGFTLIEILVTCSILGLLLGVGLPATHRLMQHVDAERDISELALALSEARNHALYYRNRVTLCPLNNALHCSSDWNMPLTLFMDSNNNRVLDPGEPVLRELPASTSGQKLRTFSGNVISFDAKGYAGIDNGSLGYCAKASAVTGAAFIISRNGRIRAGTDRDNDGLPETANGRNVACPA
ncbi:GspH/FimT family pseudopilin [Thalassolituus hydrocarboniclasticus]|uniref:Type II secretion system protein H n=1 Tax=Thalassolituus hydrocarboniclasticus TaxID=2742796 RepID=A0ABY6AEN6_9GAMM|nr:GspH/FimT family pseudopilin [Thalassolituus hydrocarboniclasticus]UXD89308.1 type II transport protein GspH [Thalassolituus hydrocarboniclasticus]